MNDMVLVMCFGDCICILCIWVCIGVVWCDIMLFVGICVKNWGLVDWEWFEGVYWLFELIVFVVIVLDGC